MNFYLLLCHFRHPLWTYHSLTRLPHNMHLLPLFVLKLATKQANTTNLFSNQTISQSFQWSDDNETPTWNTKIWTILYQPAHYNKDIIMVNLNLKLRLQPHPCKKNKAKKVNTNTLEIHRGYNSLYTINESGSWTMCTQATNQYINNDGHTKSKQKGLTSKRSFEKIPFPSKSPFPSASLPTWLSSVHCWPEKGILLLFQTMFTAQSCGRKLPISHKKCLRISYFFCSKMLNKSPDHRGTKLYEMFS